MKKVYYFAIIVSILTLLNLFYVCDAKEIPEEKIETNQHLEKDNNNKLTFRAKTSDLWFKHPITDNKKPEDFVEISLEGKLYDLPKEIPNISKKTADKSTPEGVIASYLSASKVGDVKWIADNFIDEEKDKIKSLFKNKDILKGSKVQAKTLEAEYITGHAYYKDYALLFIEQQFNTGEKVTEVIACKETPEGWKLTNSLSNDETFDIVFAALSSGEVLDSKNKKETKTSLRNKKSTDTNIHKP